MAPWRLSSTPSIAPPVAPSAPTHRWRRIPSVTASFSAAPNQRALDLVLSDREAEMMHGTATEPPAGRPDVTFRCDGEACVLIMYGRLTPADAIASGRLVVAEGNAELAATFGDRFVGG